MRLKRLFTALFALASMSVGAANTAEPVDYVSPLVGTLSKFELSTGNTYPAIAMPWGMNFWMPQTGKMGDGWAYVYTHDKIRGFKQTHQPSPWINDFGQFSVMPVTGAPEFDQDKRASWFSHKAEIAKPYYYRVYLADHDVVAEMAPTDRAVAMRFTFPESDKSYIVVDAFDRGSYAEIIPEQNMIVGYTTRNSGGVPENFKNYFVLKFDKPFTYKAAVADGKVDASLLKSESNHSGAIVGFKTKRGEQVNVQVASSFISPEQALLNLKELGDGNFERVKQQGRDRWNEVLGRIEVEDDNVDHLRTFYSCLYRSALFPHSFYEMDANGQPIHYSPHNGKVLPGYLYTGTGFWDTFRCLFPLLNLVYPSVNEKMQAGFVNVYKESGFLPEWSSPGHRGCMVGNNSASVVADAYLKGLRGFDAETLWEAVKHGANAVHPQVSSTGRLGFEYYNKLGYVPYDVSATGSSMTLEYAYDDWVIYNFCRETGRDSLAAVYRDRAFNYRNVFDPETGFARARMSDGSWKQDFNLYDTHGQGFIEGNSWNYSMYVPHDPAGLVELMGGDRTFVSRLDSLFTEYLPDRYFANTEDVTRDGLLGMYVHGNEPSHHVPYLYMWTSKPWKTQYWIREIMDRMYRPEVDGLCGNDDCGQMSAWYVFSAMGFYPVCPGSGQYVIGAPHLPYMKVRLENGRCIEIKADGVSSENRYIHGIKLDGRPYRKAYFTYDDLKDGAVIEFDMRSRPDKGMDFGPDGLPYSLSRE